MKKSTIFWSVLLVVFGAFVIQHARMVISLPMEFTPNWLTILPTIAIWAAFIGLIIRKAMTAAESRTRAAHAELAALRVGTPFADLA